MSQESVLPMSSLIDLGWRLRDLSACSENWPISASDSEGRSISGQIDSLIESIANLDLSATHHQSIMGLKRVQWALEYSPPPNRLLGKHALPLRQQLQNIKASLDQEAKTRQLLHMRPLDAVDVNELIEAPLLVFNLPNNLAEDLPIEVVPYLEEAARCIAAGFELAACATVAAATEAIIRLYYFKITGNKPVDRKGETMTWGEIVWNLRQLTKTETISCSDQLIEDMQTLCKQRNNIMHANSDLVVDSQVAFAYWQLCSYLVQDMVQDLSNNRLLSGGIIPL